ncbi:hypothetical protein A7U60_g2185 [Sanghuangporus baumii]|uniref:Uncharacterized protein n=1 Tax=Sanghuangporus baumii TaxID=108892 RepID=A0A9Q5I2N2_SANBA|nr:hypothetical protein A7U60_g2185 [Sanghuangporus baumii]
MWSFEKIQEDLVALLSALTRLKTFRYPKYGLTSVITNSLSQLPLLGVVAVGDRKTFRFTFCFTMDREPNIPASAFDHLHNPKGACLGSLGSIPAPWTPNSHDESRYSGDLPPLQEFSKLESLRFDYDLQFQLSTSELVDLVSYWPALEEFRFCLVTHIGLPALGMQRHDDSGPRFSSLRHISFGKSPLAEEDALEFALFVSSILSRSCSIDVLYEVDWVDEMDPHECNFWMDTIRRCQEGL